jgi:hypothetical protein
VKSCAAEIFSSSGTKDNAKCVENEEYRRLLGVTEEGDYPILPPVLFPGGVPSTALNVDIFRSEILVNVTTHLHGTLVIGLHFILPDSACDTVWRNQHQVYGRFQFLWS